MRTLCLLVVIAVPVFAQNIYTWEDKDGTHATDDLSQVPKTQKVEATVPDPKHTSKGLEAPKARPLAAVTTTEASSEYEWRDRFIAAHRRIDTLRRSLAALEATLPPRIECVPQPTRPGASVPAGQATARCQVNALHDQLRAHLAVHRAPSRVSIFGG